MAEIYIVKAKKTYLKSPLSTTATTLKLKELVDSRGNAISMASFGAMGVVVLTQGDVVEQIKFTNLSRASDGVVTLTIDTNGRDILPVTPYTGSSTGKKFNAGADAIITNDPLTMMYFALKSNANTWDLLQTFTVTPITNGGDATTANALVRKAQLDTAILGIVTSVSIIAGGTAGETLVAGNLIYLNTADNRWWKADADIASTVENVILGIAQGAGTAGGAITSGVLLRGVDSHQSGLTAGAKYYASNTAGGISVTVGTKTVTVGIAKSTTELYFEPHFDQILTQDMINALVGTSGIPSSTNKFVTNDDTTGTGAVVRSSILTSIGASIFGDGSDGDVIIGAGTTTLTKDMYYNNLTIQTGAILNPNGYRIFVKGTLTGQGTGIIARNGSVGGAGGVGANYSGANGGAGGSAGTGATGLSAGSISGSLGGSNGGAGGGGGSYTNAGFAGGAGTSALTLTNSIGSASPSASNGVAGGAGGGTSGGTAGTGVSANAVSIPPMMPLTPDWATSLHFFAGTSIGYMAGSNSATGGTGGGGGGGGTNEGGLSGAGGGGGGGGGGGACGGVVMVCANTIVSPSATFIQALGGGGGSGGSGGTGGFNGGSQRGGGGSGGSGGTGGTGGVVVVLYKTYTGTALTTACVAGGAGGSAGTKGTSVGAGTGVDGSNGLAGTTGATGKLYQITI